MGTYYLVVDGNSFDTNHLEYVSNTDKIHLILRSIPKKGNVHDILENKYLKNSISCSIIKGFSEDVVDFTLIPMLYEIVLNNKDMNVVVISSNHKLSCLNSYYRDKFNTVIEFANTIKDYTVVKFIEKSLHISYEDSLSIFGDLVKYRDIRTKDIPLRIKVKLEKNRELLDKLLEITYIDSKEILESTSKLSISRNETKFFENRLLEYDIELSETALKRISYFLRKSDNFDVFKDRLNSAASSLLIDKETKERLLEDIKVDLFKGII